MGEHEKKAKALIKNTALYTISNFGSKILSFLIVPLYTYYLSTSEYGTYDTIVSVVSLVGPMCILAIHEGILRWLLKSEENTGTVACTGFSMYLCFIGITDAVLLLLFQVYKWDYSLIFVLCLSSSTLFEILQFATRGVKRNLPFAMSGVIQTILMLSLNVIYVIFFKLGIRGMLYSSAISKIVSSVYLIVSIRSEFRYQSFIFSKKLAKEMLIYSILLVPNNISWWVMNSSDRLMLTAMIGSAYTGIYSIACKFPSLLNMLHSIFYRAWQEQAVLEYDSKARDEYYSKVFNMYMRLGCCAVLMLIPASKLYIRLSMSETYREAYVYIGVLMLGTLFSSFSGFYGTGYISAKDTKNATLTTMIGALINCTINLLFINSFGIWAACFSTFAGYLVTWIMRIKQTRKYFKIDVCWKEFAILLSLCVLFSVMVTLKDNVSAIVMLLVAVAASIWFNRGVIKNAMAYLRGRVQR